MLKSCLGSVLRALNNWDMGKCISEVPNLGTKQTKFLPQMLPIFSSLCSEHTL